MKATDWIAATSGLGLSQSQLLLKATCLREPGLTGIRNRAAIVEA